MSLQTFEPSIFQAAAASPAAPLFVVRHARSVGQDNINNYRTIGDHALPLSPEKAPKQIETAGALINAFDGGRANGKPLRVIFSTCVRAESTGLGIAQHLRQPLTLQADTRLDKQSWGVFDGLFSDEERAEKFPDLAENYNAQVQALGLYYARPAGGQSIADIEALSEDLLHEIANDPAPTVLVTHGLNALVIEKIVHGHDEQWVLDRLDTVPNCNVRLITDSQNARTLTLDNLG
jgi:phosphohistidine phosphatase SixA